MSATARPQPDGSALRSRFAALRRRMRLVAGLRGAGWLLATVLATVVLAGLLDFRFHLPGLVRAVVLTGLLTGGGAIIWRLLVEPLSEPADDLSLALRVEQRFPDFNDALASTVEFVERDKAPAGESASMRQEAVRRTMNRVGGLDFNRVIDSRGLRAAVGSGLAALLVAGLFAALAPRLAATAVRRLATPFAAVEWPRKTAIEYDSVVRRVGEQMPYRLRGNVRGVIPKDVVAEIDYDGFATTTRAFPINPADNSFEMALPPSDVNRSFRFRLLANDAVTPTFEVEVLTLPRLTAIDGRPSPQIELVPPAYTGLPTPQKLSPGSAHVEAIAGTVVRLRAAFDRPVRRVWLEFHAETGELPAALAVAPLGADSPLGVVGSAALGLRGRRPVEARLAADRKSFEAHFRPMLHGTYSIHAVDDLDMHVRFPREEPLYPMRLLPDPAPTVRLAHPSPSRDLLRVLPTAQLPLHVFVDDEKFAVRAAWLEYRTRLDEPPRRLPLYDHREGLGRAAAAGAGPGVLLAPVPRLRLPRLEITRTLPLAALHHADGSPLKEGDVVLIQGAADDFDDVSPIKEPGRSTQVKIEIVGRDGLELDLNREQGKIQEKLKWVRDRQREPLTKLAEVEQRLRKGGKLAPEREAQAAEEAAQKAQDEATTQEQLAEKAGTEKAAAHRQKAQALRARAQEFAKQAEALKRQATQFSEAKQIQEQIRERIGDRDNGLRAEIERVRDTLRQNGLENSSAMDRMKRIAAELDRIVEKDKLLERIEDKLADAQKQAELQDETTRSERRAELLKRGDAAERQAKAAEALARKLNEQAAQAEKAAAAAAGAERQRHQQQANELRRQAREQEQAAAEKQAQARADRADAERKPDPGRIRQALADARRSQEEVERSLDALLQDLEPWSSTREIKGEAGRILQEQKERMAQLEDLQKKGLTGKNPEELTPEQKADLAAAEDAQRRLAERAQQLLGQMKRIAEDRAERDPETARELQEATRQAEEGNLAGRMKDAGSNIARNRLNKAKEKQREAMAELEKLVKNLEDRREAELDRLARKLREAEKRVEELMDEQERLQRKMREAGKMANGQQREQEMARLAKQQQQLRQKTRDLMEQMSRLRNERAKQALDKAGEEMAEAARQLSRGQRDDDKQEDVLDRLDDARRELERARRRKEEELAREQLARVADVIRRIRDRQFEHIQEAKRIQDRVLESKGWTRGLKSSLGDLGRHQKGLAEETQAVARKDLSSAAVFARLLERAARAMDAAGDRFAAMLKKEPGLEALPDARSTEQQALALRRLDQLLGSLKESREDPRPLARNGGDEDGGGGGGGGGNDDGLPPMAQLKLLRAMQKEVNDRTEAFRKKHPDAADLGPAAKADLEEIRREQKEVADLLDQLTRPAGDAPPDDDKAKEKDAKEADK